MSTTVRKISGVYNPATGRLEGLITGDPGPQEQTPLPAWLVGKAITTGGRRLAAIGGSHNAQNHPSHNAGGPTYQRGGGFASVRITDGLYRVTGQRFTLTCKDVPGIEGDFELSANAVPESGGHRWTWADPGPAVVLGSVTADINILETSAWQVGQGWLAYMEAAMGNPHRVQVFGVGGAGLDDWAHPDRRARLLASAPYDEIFANFVGNQILGSSDTSDVVMSKLVEMLDFLSPLCRLLVVPTPPAVRSVALGTDKWTRASVVMQKMRQYLPARYPNLLLLDSSQTNESSWSPYNVATPADVLNGWPALPNMQEDGIHFAHGGALAWGLGHAAARRSGWPVFSPGFGRASDNNVDSVGTDGGQSVLNLLEGFYGEIATAGVSGTGLSGPAPVGATVTWSNRGNAAMVSSLEAHPAGGSQWLLSVTDPASSTNGPTLNVNFSPAGLAARLQAKAGQLCYLQLPLAVGGWNENSVVYVTAGLFATIDGVEVPIADCLADRGTNTQFDSNPATARAMGPGFSLTLRSPVAKIPAGVYSAAVLRILVKHVPDSVAPAGAGAYTLAIGPDLRLEAFPASTYFIN